MKRREIYDRCLLVPTSQRKNMLTRLSTIAPQNAAAKLSTWKPGTIADASSSMRALITNQKVPSVSSVKGKVMMFKKATSVAILKTDGRTGGNGGSRPRHG